MAPKQARIVTYKDLLALAHAHGLQSIVTDLIQIPGEENGRTAMFKATVTMEQNGVVKTFTGWADASPANVAPTMLNCLPRMAETRSKARALRDAVNIGEVSAEELPTYSEERETNLRSTPGSVGAVNNTQSACPSCNCPPGKAHATKCQRAA